MTRIARVGVAYRPHHVVQREHNRQGVFTGDEHFEPYLEEQRPHQALNYAGPGRHLPLTA